MTLWLLILGTALLRLAFGWALGLGVDESYMVSAGRVLSLGYYDHPPASWWLAWGAAHLTGSEAPIVVRLPFIALFAVSTWLMYRLGAAIADRRVGLWAAILLNLSPVFGLTTGTWVLPDGPLDCALLAAALCLVHALRARCETNESTPDAARASSSWPGLARPSTSGLPARREDMDGRAKPGHDDEGATVAPLGALVRRRTLSRCTLSWWLAAGLCAGLALFSKYSAILTMAGALLYLASSREHRQWLARPAPYLAALIAALVFSPVLFWNTTHGWASFAFQGARAAGAHVRPFAPFVTLAGEALFVLPWIWLPMMAVFVAAIHRGPRAWRSWLLCCLAAPPILVFALISAWSSQRVLFHWAAPGYLMLFPLLGDEVARRLHQPVVRRLLVGTAALVVLSVAVVATQVRFDWLHPVIAAVTRRDPDIEAIDWTSVRDDLMARDMLRPGTIVGVPNWRDAGKIAHALGPDVTTLCLSRDCRQFGIAYPPAQFIGADVLILAPEHGDRVPAELGRAFDSIEPMPDAAVRHAGRVLQEVSVFRGHHLRTWPLP